MTIDASIVTESRPRVKPALRGVIFVGDDLPRSARVAVAVAHATAAAVGVAWWQLAPERAFEVVLAVLVVTCPCALALATPAAFTVATSALARRGFMVRRPGALQRLHRVTDVVFDKTGTLTEPATELAGVEMLRAGDPAHAVAIAAALEARSEHPLARAFPAPSGTARVGDVRTVPGCGLEGSVDGERWRIGHLEFVQGLSGGASPVADRLDAAARVVYLGDAQGLLARFEITEALRPGAPDALARLRALGVRLAIASGDRPGPVEALAQRLGVADRHAGLRPADKLVMVQRWQQQGRVVAMLGDGINDSPVLAGADISVAMGSGTSLAQHSADCVLVGRSLDVLPLAVATARRTMSVVRQNLAWAAAYNLVALPLAAAGLLAPWMAALGMSASSLLVTGNALRLGRLPSLPAAPAAEGTSPKTATRPCCGPAAGASS